MPLRLGFGLSLGQLRKADADEPLPPGPTPEAQFNDELNSQLIVVILEDF